MQNATMYEYQSYLLHVHGDAEREAQRDLKYCDGSMQTYLERMIRKEPINVREGFLKSFMVRGNDVTPTT